MIDASALFSELRRITATWNNYEDVPVYGKAACRELGIKLNNLGGVPLMQEAYYHAKAANPDVAVIQAYWEGIGDWKW